MNQQTIQSSWFGGKMFFQRMQFFNTKPLQFTINRLSLLSLVFVLNLVSASCVEVQSRKPMIPSLPWEIRSDWVSVKTPKTWHNLVAKGNGVSDDTGAIQVSIGKAAILGGTVYFPPGRYRITDTLLLGTLQMDSATRPLGFSLIGHGRDTVFVWDGPKNLPMLRLLGITCSQIIGITFEGCSKASAAFDMGGLGFQAHNLFRHCAFLNCIFSGIDSGRRKQNTGCTEQRIENCLFQNCGRGVSLADFNDYDCVIEGCEFRKCTYAIWTFKGNFYCRDTHFEESRECDVFYESEHTSTLRRCTSLGSKQFLRAQTPICSTVLQDCHVASWYGTCAISQNIMPILMFDCSFKGKRRDSTVIKFVHSATENMVSCNKFANSKYFKLICSNNQIQSAKFYRASSQVKIYNIPVSDKAKRLPKLDAGTSFLKTKAIAGAWTKIPHTTTIPGKIFDVKRDFGAKGGEHDDTMAFKKAIAAAKAHGNGAMVYMPTGHYTVCETLVIDGANWIFGGSGLATKISWYGSENSTLLHVKSPQGVLLEGFEILRMGGRKDGLDILQTGKFGKPSLAVYDTVKGFGFLTAQPLVRGIRFKDMGKDDRALSRGTFGNLQFVNSQAAEILINNHYEGTILVEGNATERTGITAFQFALLEICNPCLWIKNNNSLIMTDFYNEQSKSIYRFESNDSKQRGRISLGTIKIEASPKYLDGYSGEITLGTPQFYTNQLNGQSKFENCNSGKVDILVLGGYFYTHSLHWNKAPDFHVRFLATGGGPDKNYPVKEFLKTHADSTDASVLDQAGRFLDDMRRVGKLDLELNHPGIAAIPK